MIRSSAQPLPYRAMTLGDLARHLRDADSDSVSWRLIAEFLEYRWEEAPGRLRRRAVANPPNDPCLIGPDA